MMNERFSYNNGGPASDVKPLIKKRTVLPVFGQNGSFGLSWSERQFILPFSNNDSIRRFHGISPKFPCAKLAQENA